MTLKSTLHRKSFLILIALLLPYWAICQIEVTGKVKNGTTPIPFANVALVDSLGVLKSGATTDNNGIFTIRTVKGKYRLKINLLGYESWDKEINLENNSTLDDIILILNSRNLEEVVIKGKKEFSNNIWIVWYLMLKIVLLQIQVML